MPRLSRALLGICLVCAVVTSSSAAPPVIERRLPPQGIDLPSEEQSQLTSAVAELKRDLAEVRDHALAADVEVYVKAVDLALRHGEFYGPKDSQKARDAIQTARSRLAELKRGQHSWTNQRGLVVRGYRSDVDGSAQPYGLAIPQGLSLATPAPLYVWLHGRGDKATDLHFIDQRQKSVGEVAPDNALVLHPFGRQCIGFKSAGEIDILDAIAHAKSQYNIDADRIVLMGFSMGGAGAWHVGAHYTDRFAAISPGAGFAETARYINLKPADYPSWFEQRLWGLYDVPRYTRNLLNVPVVAYSGELDKQIQAARVMEEAFQVHDQILTHLIGPGMGHKYHPDTLQEIMNHMQTAAKGGIDRMPTEVHLQTQTLRYNRMHWVEALGLREHWQDSRIDARIVGPRRLQVSTQNVTHLALRPWPSLTGVTIEIDGETITTPTESSDLSAIVLTRDETWNLADAGPQVEQVRKLPVAELLLVGQAWSAAAGWNLAKLPQRQGPIDDAFLEPFLVVTPTGRSRHVAIQDWVDGELQHFLRRWPALFRGDLRVKQDVDVTVEDVQKYHLIVWGDPDSNSLLKDLASVPGPIHWTPTEVIVGEQRFSAEHHVPTLIYPLGDRYVVLNSGPTFRDGHDRTNSLQNPKLPDWAIIDVRQPPNDLTPGKIVAADFFDERWQLKSRVLEPTSQAP